jgi:hypothetical protein
MFAVIISPDIEGRALRMDETTGRPLSAIIEEARAIGEAMKGGRFSDIAPATIA